MSPQHRAFHQRPQQPPLDHTDAAYTAKEKLARLFDELGRVSSTTCVREGRNRPNFFTTAEREAAEWRGFSFFAGEVERERDAAGRRLRIVTREKDDEGHRIVERTNRVTFEQMCLFIEDHLDDVQANIMRIGDDIEDAWQRFRRCSRALLARFESLGGTRREHWVETDA
jgi:hypothetical protein